jgi:RIO-like serine/threonine protein kinase
MVTMDVVGDGYRCFDGASRGDRLYEEMREKLAGLHQAGFVHGDVRDTNVMVLQGSPGFMLVDFDWAGQIGEVQYPMNVNRGPDLVRPDGAYDGELIMADDDMEMLAIMFGRSKYTV